MSAAADPSAGHEIFFHEVRREGRPLVVLRGVSTPGGTLVETAVYPLSETATTEPLRRPFPFSSPLHATRFADEALAALEYLGCVVN